MTFSCYSYDVTPMKLYSYEVIRNLNCKFNFREELSIFIYNFIKNWGEELEPPKPPLATPLQKS